MEVLLAKVTQQAMSYAIRSGLAITSSYALKQCGRLMKTVDGKEKDELARLQMRLDSKISIISPAIDMIELIAARGNTSLESAVGLTKSLRWEIQSLGNRVELAVAQEQLTRRGSSKAKSRDENVMELKMIIIEMRNLLDKIEDAVPLINLAITTSGVNLSTTLPATVSPSRLLQASTFLTSGDMQYCSTSPRAQQIGPTFFLSMYMLFSGHTTRSYTEDLRETTWKEVMHKARVTLMRVPLDNVFDYPTPFDQNKQRADESNHRHIPSDSRLQEYAYQLLIVEDLDDGRVHSFEDDEPPPGPYDGIEQAGVREIVPIHEVSKIFYADTGKILNIGSEGETNNPILLLKRDINAAPPRRMMERDTVETGYESEESHTVAGDESDLEQSELDAQLHRESTPTLQETVIPEPEPEPEPQTFPWRLPPTLDLEWMAFEVYTEESPSDSEFDETEDLESEIVSPSSPQSSTCRSDSVDPTLVSGLDSLHLRPSTPSSSLSSQNTQLIPSPQKSSVQPPHRPSTAPSYLPPIKTSLSLLEMLIRLTALQQFQQSSHLAIPDEFLNFFLSDSSTVGAGGDGDLRRKVRREARMRVGFDPYDESPIKRRGEQYLEHELHETHEAYDPASPTATATYDYDGYPSARASSPYSRSGTPSIQTSSSTFNSISTPISPNPPRSSTSNLRNSLTTMQSPSPLLRRATTQTPMLNRLKQPSFQRPVDASRAGGLQRLDQHLDPGQRPIQGLEQGQNAPAFRGSVAPDTPPSSVRRAG